jgi:hypothetical protein
MHHALEEFLARSGSPVTAQHVARVVHERIGSQIETRRLRIREAASALSDDSASQDLMRSRPDRTPAPAATHTTAIRGDASAETRPLVNTTLSAGASTAPARPSARPTNRPGATKYALGVGGAAFVATLGALAVWSWARDSQPPASAGQPSGSSTAPVTPSRSLLSLRPTPKTATIEVDGVMLGAGDAMFARPMGDQVKIAIVRAPGYTQQTVRIDTNAADTIDVALNQSAPSTDSSTTPVSAASRGSAPAGPRPAMRPASAGKKPPPPLPPNPFAQ